MTGLRGERKRVSRTIPPSKKNPKADRIGNMESDSGSGEEAQATFLPAARGQKRAAVAEREGVIGESSRTAEPEQSGGEGAQEKSTFKSIEGKSADAELPAGLLPAALPRDAESAARR